MMTDEQIDSFFDSHAERNQSSIHSCTNLGNFSPVFNLQPVPCPREIRNVFLIYPGVAKDDHFIQIDHDSKIKGGETAGEEKVFVALIWVSYTLVPFVAGWSSLVARQAHNLKVVGSNPTPAPNLTLINNLNLKENYFSLLRSEGL